MRMDAEGLGDGGAGDIRVQNGAVVAPALHFGGHQAGDKGLAHTALAADHGNDLFHAGLRVQCFAEALRVSFGAVFAAGGTIMGAFAHYSISLPFLSFCQKHCVYYFRWHYYIQNAKIVKSTFVYEAPLFRSARTRYMAAKPVKQPVITPEAARMGA